MFTGSDNPFENRPDRSSFPNGLKMVQIGLVAPGVMVESGKNTTYFVENDSPLLYPCG